MRYEPVKGHAAWGAELPEDEVSAVARCLTASDRLRSALTRLQAEVEAHAKMTSHILMRPALPRLPR